MQRRLVYILLAAGALALVVLAIVLATLMPRTGPEAPPPPGAPNQDAGQASPAHVVRAYIDAWNSKTIAGMEALMVESAAGNQAIEYDVQCVDFVELLSLEEIPFNPKRAEAALLSELYENVHAGALVEASFIIYYNDKGVEIYQTDSVERERFPFWLVKQEPTSEWLIAMQGE